ncbi:MAG: DUF4295 family protein [Rhodothermales bacterium]|nr:DUF4295 family protein [Rhodothermales bacterium]
MAKKQSFGDKVLRQKAEAKKMAKVIVSTKKENGQYSFQQKMVEAGDVQAVIKESKQ